MRIYEPLNRILDKIFDSLFCLYFLKRYFKYLKSIQKF